MGIISPWALSRAEILKNGVNVSTKTAGPNIVFNSNGADVRLVTFNNYVPPKDEIEMKYAYLAAFPFYVPYVLSNINILNLTDIGFVTKKLYKISIYF